MGRISSAAAAGVAASFLLLFFLRSSATSPPPPASQPGFCQRSISSATCPSPPTFDSLNLTSYAGAWFQIGVTARFQLQSEPGLVCVKALYTLPGDGSVSVLNSGVSVLSPNGTADIVAAGAATASACSAARSACLASPSANAKHALEAAALRVSRIQALLIEASEGNYSGGGVGGAIEAEAAALRRVEVAALLEAARKEGRKDLVRDAREIEKAAKVVAKRGRALGKKGSGVPKAAPTPVAVPGRAVPVGGGGKLAVSFFGGPAAPYWVLAVEGNYEAALVYSCTDTPARQDKSLYILSRTPSLPPSTISKLLSLASSYSISTTDCDDAFFLTRQSSCSAAAA